MSNIGKLARLTKKQSNRAYFCNIPIGTFFIITEEHNDMPAYEFTGLFLRYPPQSFGGDNYYYTGYIEKGTCEVIGTVEENINLIW